MPSSEDFVFELQAQLLENCTKLNATDPLPTDKLYCPRIFDGWSCWNHTESGKYAFAPCPHFIQGFLPDKFGHKLCQEDGTWFRHPATGEAWSNYTSCIDLDDWKFRQDVNRFYIIGYSVSLAALLIALALYFYLKSLCCARITIHKNLFVSFLLNNICWLIWYKEVLEKSSVMLENKISCQVLHFALQYFLVSNYFWMFCEGLYLHLILVVTFITEQKVLRILYVIGWFLPSVLVAAYVILREVVLLDADRCLIETSPASYVLSVPVVISMIANFGFSINVIRILVVKLRSRKMPSSASGTKRAIRATLILIPLLGLQYFITPFRPSQGSKAEVMYEYFAATVASYQGLCVALLFCIFNGEVLSCLRNKVRLWIFVRKISAKDPSFVAVFL